MWYHSLKFRCPRMDPWKRFPWVRPSVVNLKAAGSQSIRGASIESRERKWRVRLTETPVVRAAGVSVYGAGL